VAPATVATPPTRAGTVEAPRLRDLHLVGALSGLTAGAWLGAAEAPTKLVVAGLSPVLISFCMVLGVFVGRWSLPALVHGARYVRTDLGYAPHLIVWAILGGCLWAVANTLTVYAIRDVGLSIAFPLWNMNGLIGLAWGVLFFKELRGASRPRRSAVVCGGIVMCVAAAIVANAASRGALPNGSHAGRGIIAALTAGLLWGTMYVPYRKAYITGLSPLSFLTFFTAGEMVMMTGLAVGDAGGWGKLLHAVDQARPALIWLLLGGLVWVIGDVFQQYAAKYVGISRGIPLSNTNQLWGLLWGVLVFGELRGSPTGSVVQVVAGSLLMVLGAALIATAGADHGEQRSWQAAAAREGTRYGVDERYVSEGGLGRQWHDRGGDGQAGEGRGGGERRRSHRSWIDWFIVAAATCGFLVVAAGASTPRVALNVGWAAALSLVLVGSAIVAGVRLWRTTGWS
jgi:glucose uptake protein GlcU